MTTSPNTITRPAIVTLCGSGRFKEQIEQMNASLTLQGFIVLAPGVFLTPHEQSITQEQKSRLDDLHLRKIDISDTIFVVNPGGYIGESTMHEIRYAWSTRKPVGYLTSPLPEMTMMSTLHGLGH